MQNAECRMQNLENYTRYFYILNSAFCVLHSSVESKIIATLICPGSFLPNLHQDVIEQRRRANAKEIRRHPFRPHRLVQEHEIRERQLRVGNTARRLHADFLPGDVMKVTDYLEHDHIYLQLRVDRDLSDIGLDEISARVDSIQL